jgi:hypothetical protein
MGSLFSWTTIGGAEVLLLTAVVALVGIGFGVPIAQSSSWFLAAQACFVTAAIVFLLKVAEVAITNDFTFLRRAVLCAVLFGVVGVVSVEAARALGSLRGGAAQGEESDNEPHAAPELKPEPLVPLAPPTEAATAPVAIPVAEPKVDWHQRKVDRSGGKYRVEVVLEVDKEYPDPIFGVLCDRPCTPELLGEPGVTTSLVWSDGNNPNLGVGQITSPDPLKPGVPVAWWIRSKDGQPIKVLVVKKARIKR